MFESTTEEDSRTRRYTKCHTREFKSAAAPLLLQSSTSPRATIFLIQASSASTAFRHSRHRVGINMKPRHFWRCVRLSREVIFFSLSQSSDLKFLQIRGYISLDMEQHTTVPNAISAFLLPPILLSRPRLPHLEQKSRVFVKCFLLFCNLRFESSIITSKLRGSCTKRARSISHDIVNCIFVAVFT